MSAQDPQNEANTRFAQIALGDDYPYRAPETHPRIQSRQSRAILEVLSESIHNLTLLVFQLQDRIEQLEGNRK